VGSSVLIGKLPHCIKKLNVAHANLANTHTKTPILGSERRENGNC
jgi:hypothetical protein